MRHKLVAMGTVSLLAVSMLAACNNDDSGGGDGVRTVVVWDRAGAEATSRQAFFQKWNAEQGAQQGIKVQYEPQATEKYEEIVRLGFQTGRGPDIFHAPSSQVGAMVAAGWIQPLEGLVGDDVLKSAEKYLPDTSELVWDGKPYAVPTTTFTVRMAINRGLFKQAGLNPDKPPTTFHEVEQAAAAITRASGGKAYGVALPMAWVGFRQWIVDLPILATDTQLAQNGLFNMSGGTFESERYAPVVTHYRNLITSKTAYPGAATLNNDPMLGAFAEGKIGMVLASGSIVGSLKKLGSKIEFGVGPIPVPDGMTQQQSPMNAGFPYAISSKVKDTEAAAAVFEALVGPDMQESLAASGIPPLSMEAWDSQAAKANASLQQYRPTDKDKQWPKTPGTVISVEGQDATKTIQSLLLNPGTDAGAELRKLSERYQSAYQTGLDNGEVDAKEFGG